MSNSIIGIELLLGNLEFPSKGLLLLFVVAAEHFLKDVLGNVVG